MQRPSPGVFQGSTPAERVGDAALTHDVGRALGLSALVFALGAWALTRSLSLPEPWLAEKIGFGVLLCMSTLGVWLRRKTERAPQREAAGVYEAVLRRTVDPGGAVHNAPAESGLAGVAGLIGDLVSTIRRTEAGRTRLEVDLAATNAGFRERRQQAEHIAGELRQQAEAVSRAASKVGAGEPHIVGGADAAVRALDTADNAVSRAIDGIAAIAASVRATTAGAQQMTVAAVQVAEVAHNTHRCIAGLDDETAKIEVALDAIERAMQAAAALGDAACTELTTPGAAASAAAHAAAELRDVAGGCQPVLAEAADAMRALVAQTAAANQRTMEIAELVGANHDIGRAVGRAIEQQGEQITRILTELYEARPGFATLRAGVEAVTLACVSQTRDADALHKTAALLPAQADKLAKVLRGLPDAGPPIPY